jgi:hypothetical protein
MNYAVDVIKELGCDESTDDSIKIMVMEPFSK